MARWAPPPWGWRGQIGAGGEGEPRDRCSCPHLTLLAPAPGPPAGLVGPACCPSGSLLLVPGLLQPRPDGWAAGRPERGLPLTLRTRVLGLCGQLLPLLPCCRAWPGPSRAGNEGDGGRFLCKIKTRRFYSWLCKLGATLWEAIWCGFLSGTLSWTQALQPPGAQGDWPEGALQHCPVQPAQPQARRQESWGKLRPPSLGSHSKDSRYPGVSSPAPQLCQPSHWPLGVHFTSAVS